MLFDELDRTDASPAPHGEDSFSFLNRAAGRKWDQVRRLLETWFRDYPSEHQGDLRGRYRSNRPGSHLAAWWELYLHHLFQAMGYEVNVHPVVRGTSKRPDFELIGDRARLYVEAAVVFSGIVDKTRHGTREGWILDALNRGSSDSFFVSVAFEQTGTERPRDKEVFGPVEAWLKGLDPDAVQSEQKTSGRFPSMDLRVRDWHVRLEAIPIDEPRRGHDPSRRLVGFGPPIAGFVDDQAQIRDTASRKGSRYGDLGAPLVLGLHCTSSFPKLEDFAAALFGSIAYQYEEGVSGSGKPVRLPDGVWMSPSGPSGRRLSAVLSGVQIHPWTAGTAAPTLWLNPWANMPADVDWPFSVGSATPEGLITFKERKPNMSAVLGLPADWSFAEE